MPVMLFGPPIVREAGFEAPVRSPDHPVKWYSTVGVAVRVTLAPAAYQAVPAGVTVPPPAGLEEVARLYSVFNVAVYVVADDGAVMVWVCAPLSLQEEKTYLVVPAPPSWGEDTESV